MLAKFAVNRSEINIAPLIFISHQNLVVNLDNLLNSGTQTNYHYLLQKCGYATTSRPPPPPRPPGGEDRPKEGSVTSFPPLSDPIPGLPTPIYSDAKEVDQETEITVLSNGLRVASENRFGQFCTIGGMNQVIIEILLDMLITNQVTGYSNYANLLSSFD